MKNTKIFKVPFASVYPHYIKKAEKKGRTKAEVDEIIFWLTGYNEQTLQRRIDEKTDFENFFTKAPQLNPNVSKKRCNLWLPCGDYRRQTNAKNPLFG